VSVVGGRGGGGIEGSGSFVSAASPSQDVRVAEMAALESGRHARGDDQPAAPAAGVCDGGGRLIHERIKQKKEESHDATSAALVARSCNNEGNKGGRVAA